MKSAKDILPPVYLLCWIIISSFLFVGGCSSRPQEVSFRYNLEPGNTFRQKSVTKQTVKQEFGGEEQIVVNSIESVMTYKVVSSSEVTSEIEVSYDTLDIHISLPDRNMHFTSKGGIWNQEDLFSQVLNSMSGQSFRITINNSTGEISSFNGLEKLFEAVLNQFQNANNEQFSSIMEMLNKSYGEGAFKASFEATNAYFTDKKLKEGDEWENSTFLSNMNATLKNNWKLKEIGRNEAKIESESQLNSDNSEKESFVDGVTAKLKFTGTQTAQLTIDYNTGWTTSGEINQHFSALMHLDSPESGEQASVPIELINVITYATIE